MIARLLIAAVGLAAPFVALADGAPFSPNHLPAVAVPFLSGEIVLDGDLHDPGWRDAARATGFCEVSPGDQTLPPVETEAWIACDSTHLYIALIAHDEPTALRASMRARDEIFADDCIGVQIDTYGNANWAYELFSNPFGIQGDRRWSKDGVDASFDVVYETRGKVTGDGYQVEMAIPFKSLRFPRRNEQQWRINFVRVHPRDSRRQYSWAAVSRDNPCYLCQFGTLTGVRGAQSARTLDLLPATMGAQSGERRDYDNPDSGFDNRDPEGELSLGARYRFTSSAFAEVSVNPDFSQVESDAAQVDVNTTFALFYPEKRPFFMEGSELYRTYYNLIYTRQINDPSVAGKLSAQNGPHAAIYLFARDTETPLVLPFEERSLFTAPGRSYSNIGRYRYSFGDDSWAGVTLTDRRYDAGGSGSVVSTDLSYRFLQNYRLEAQTAGSYTEEPDDTTLTEDRVEATDTFADGAHTMALDGETFGGNGVYFSLERDARRWLSDIDVWWSDATFRGDSGFITRNSERRLSSYNGYVFYIDNAVFDQVRPNVYAFRRWNAYGTRKGQAVENTLDIVFKGQTSLELGYDWTDELFRGVDFSGIDLYYGELNTAFWDPVSFGLWAGYGDRIARTAEPLPFLGRGSALDVWATIKVRTRFVIEPTFTYSTIENPQTSEIFFKGHIWRTRFNLQFTRELLARLVLQYDDFDGTFRVEPLVSWQLNPFTVCYFGGNVGGQDYGHKSIEMPLAPERGLAAASWQAFFKFQYLFRL